MMLLSYSMLSPWYLALLHSSIVRICQQWLGSGNKVFKWTNLTYDYGLFTRKLPNCDVLKNV